MKSLNGDNAVNEMATDFFLGKDEIILVKSVGDVICVGDMSFFDAYVFYLRNQAFIHQSLVN